MDRQEERIKEVIASEKDEERLTHLEHCQALLVLLYPEEEGIYDAKNADGVAVSHVLHDLVQRLKCLKL